MTIINNRSKHGVRGRTRTLNRNVRSVGPHPWGANTTSRPMERATGIEPVSSGWKPEAQPLYQTRSHLARFTFARGDDMNTVATAARIEQAGRRFGGATDHHDLAAKYSDSLRGGRWDSNPLIRGPQPRAPPIEPRPHRNESISRRPRTSVARAKKPWSPASAEPTCARYKGAPAAPASRAFIVGAPGANRTRFLRLTKAAFGHLNFECAIVLELYAGLEPARAVLRGRCAATRTRRAHVENWRGVRESNPLELGRQPSATAAMRTPHDDRNGCGRRNRTAGTQLMRLAVLPTARPAMNDR